MTAAVLWAVVVLPFVVGSLLLVPTRAVTDRGGGRVAAVSVVTACLTSGLAVVAALTRGRAEVPFMAGTPFVLEVDGLSAVMLPTVALVTVLVLVFASADIDRSRARFHGLMLVFAAAACLTVVAGSVPTLLVAWELMGATSYALVGFWWREERRVSSGATAFLTTRAADLGLYVAAGAALAGGAGMRLSDLADATPGWRTVLAVGIAVAALGKAAQLPFSFWLSRAMDGPSPVSALLHSAAMVALGGYLLLRVHPLLAAAGWPATAVAWVGGLTALLMGAVAVCQRDLKQLLAASTSAQLGFVVLGAGVGTVAGGLTHLVAHAATKALLFLVAGAWLAALGTKQLDDLRGAARRYRVVGVVASVGLLSLAGVAPLSLWATKDVVLTATREQSLLLFLVSLAAAALSAAYAGRVLLVVWGPVPEDSRGLDTEEAGTRRVTGLQQAPLVVLALGAAVSGALVLPPLGEAVRRAVGERDGLSLSPLELGGSAVLALAVLALVRVVRLPAPGPLRAWWHLEAGVHVGLVGPTLALARSLARFDDRVLDRGVTALSASVGAVARTLARWDDRGVDAAVERLATGTRSLGRLAVRPQTGQLHQYYVQAVAVLAAVFVLVLVVR